MSWSTELRRKYPDLPVKPNGISDEDWATFVGVWNGDTLKVAGEKRGLGYNRLSRIFFLVRMRLPPPPKVSPQFPFAPGALIRFHIPGCTGARGHINDDGMLAIVGAEKEEDDEPHQ